MAVATTTVIAATALAATAVSGYQQYQAASDAADDRREGQAISSASQQNRDQQQRRQQLREQRVRRARILQASANTGVGGSSSEIGSIGALNTTTSSNIANIAATSKASAGIGRANQSAADAATRGEMWGAIGQTSGSIFDAAGGFGSAFNTNSSTPVNGGWSSEVFTI